MHPAHTYPYKTTDPQTRRCVKCGSVLPVTDFVAPMSEAHARMWGYGTTDVEGFTNIYGKFTRGYRRIPKRQTGSRRNMLSLKCPTCRKPPPKPKHPLEKGTFKLVMDQIRAQRTRLRALISMEPHLKDVVFDHDPREKYFTIKRVMLDQAASNAREYRRRGTAMPFKLDRTTTPPTHHYRWENLLSDIQRALLVDAHARVSWNKKVPEIF